MVNRQNVKYNLRFYFRLCFSRNLPLPPPNTPLLSLSYWPSVSVTVTTQLKQLSTWYVRQYSTVSNSKVNYIIFNMTVFCDGEETNTFEAPNELSERKSQKNTCTNTMFLQSDKCNIQLSLCTSWPHMGERRYSCTLCGQTISWPLFEVLTFLFLHKISLAIKWSRWLFHSLHILVYLILWVTGFSITYPHSLVLRVTLALYECVWSASHSTCITVGENAEYHLNRGLDGPQI